MNINYLYENALQRLNYSSFLTHNIFEKLNVSNSVIYNEKKTNIKQNNVFILRNLTSYYS